MIIVESRAVVADNGDRVRVVNKDPRVMIEWACGDTRTFDPGALMAAVASIDALAAHGVWFQGHDSSSYGFAGIVVDGMFYADRHTRESVESLHGVPWAELRKAIKKTLRAFPKPEPLVEDEDEDADEDSVGAETASAI